MKIALVLDRFDPRLGGLELWAQEYARFLVRRGHGVHVAAFEHAVAEDGVTPHRVARPASRLDAARALGRCAESLPVDFVHDLGSGSASDILHPPFGCRRAGLARQQAALPLLRRLRGALSPAERRRRRELLQVEAEQLAAARGPIVAMSRRVGEQFRTLCAVDAARIHVVHNGVDTEHFSPGLRERHREATRTALGLGRGTTAFLIAANNFALKGVPTALRAMRRIAARGADARLIAIGRSAPADVERYARRLGLGAHVTFAGRVADARPFYAAADALVLPTFYDPCSLAVLEAWACGIPAVTTSWNGASELMQDGRHGFVLERSDDDAALAENLVALLDPDRRHAMGQAARELALAHTMSSKFEEIETFYRSAARA